jgi:hypothetical protein
VLQKVDGVDDHLLNIEDNLLDIKDNLFNIEDNLFNIEDNLFNIEDNLLNIEDNLDNVIENLADVIENLANVDENLADLEDKIGGNVADRLLNRSNFAQNAVPPDLFRVFGGIYHMGEPIGPPLIVSRGAAGRRRTLNGALGRRVVVRYPSPSHAVQGAASAASSNGSSGRLRTTLTTVRTRRNLSRLSPLLRSARHRESRRRREAGRRHELQRRCGNRARNAGEKDASIRRRAEVDTKVVEA